MTRPAPAIADVEPAPPPKAADVAALRALAERLWRAKKGREGAVAIVATFDKEIELLESKLLPDAMRTIGARTFPFGKGWRLELSKIVSGSVREDAQPAAWDWMKSHGFGPMLKRVVAVSFGKGEDRAYKKFMASLARRKVPLAVEVTETVHGATLKAFVRRRVDLEDSGKVPPDKRIPRDLFGVYSATKVELVAPEGESKEKGK